MEAAPPGVPEVLFGWGAVLVAVVIAVLLLLSLWRVAQRQRGAVVGIIGALSVVAGTVASCAVLWSFGLVWSLALEGSAVFSSLVSMLLNILIHLAVWTGVVMLVLRVARGGRG